MIAGSVNPLNYLFEENDGDTETGLTVTYELPFVEIETLSEQEVNEALARKMIFIRSHSLADILDGKIKAGFRLAGLFESMRTDARAPAINQFAPTYIAT